MTYSREIKIGDRVELHPAMDAWMMGDRYGTVEKIDRTYAVVRMDKSGKLRHIAPDMLASVRA